jgi:hypothetical protein
MKNTNQVKHSKYKNTGILFELLVRQITLEILNGSDNPKAKNIVAKYFGKNTQLHKELKLYELLMKEKYNSDTRAEKFVDTILEAYDKLDYQKLSKEKYNLVKEIRDNFDITEFLSYPISNYKVMASIYKLFESKSKTDYDLKDIFNSKITIIENIVSSSVVMADKKDQLIESYKKQEKDLRLLTYKILVETFNKKYTNLDTSQKTLLKEYINNVSNTSKFKDYVLNETPKIVAELKSLHKRIGDKVTKIKLNETINTLNKLKVGKGVSDNHVSALMLSYELIKELKSKL